MRAAPGARRPAIGAGRALTTFLQHSTLHPEVANCLGIRRLERAKRMYELYESCGPVCREASAHIDWAAGSWGPAGGSAGVREVSRPDEGSGGILKGAGGTRVSSSTAPADVRADSFVAEYSSGSAARRCWRQHDRITTGRQAHLARRPAGGC